MFFIVPDVYLTRLALRDFRQAVTASLWALAGALLGGSGLWYAARHGEGGALLNLFEQLPGINADMIEKSRQAVSDHGLTALFSGAFRGQPYKLYAVYAGAKQVPLVAFLAASACARFLRFFVTITLAWIAGNNLAHRSARFRHWTHAFFWLTFYVVYFAAMR
jgi:membrane protein DedA with SNARE-associated domain